jgi:hypothetical protein
MKFENGKCIDSVYLCLMLLLISPTLAGQVKLFSEIKATHLSYNDIGGAQLASGLELFKNKNIIILKSHLIYATGNRDFENAEGVKYSLVDGANRQDYPLPGLIPGLEESAYIKAFKLNTAKTMDIGIAISYGRIIMQSTNSKLSVDLGINFSWVEESSIKYEYKGDLTNVLATIKDIHLIAPYTQNFFDLGPQFSVKYDFITKTNASFGVKADATWLTQSGFKYSFGPTYSVYL